MVNTVSLTNLVFAATAWIATVHASPAAAPENIWLKPGHRYSKFPDKIHCPSDNGVFVPKDDNYFSLVRLQESMNYASSTSADGMHTDNWEFSGMARNLHNAHASVYATKNGNLYTYKRAENANGACRSVHA